MDEHGQHQSSGVPPSIIGDLRALEWELLEILRRVEMVRDQVRELQDRHIALEASANGNEGAS